MKTVIIFIGIYLLVTSILVYQVINPIQSEIIIINGNLKKQTVDSLNNVKDFTNKAKLKSKSSITFFVFKNKFRY